MTLNSPPTAPAGPSEPPEALPAPWYRKYRTALIAIAGVAAIALIGGVLTLGLTGGQELEGEPPSSEPGQIAQVSEKELAIEEAKAAVDRYFDFNDKALVDPRTGWRKDDTLIGADEVATGKEVEMLTRYINAFLEKNEGTVNDWGTEFIGVTKARVSGKKPTVVMEVCRDRSKALGIDLDTGKALPPSTESPARFVIQLTVVETKDGWKVSNFESGLNEGEAWNGYKPC